MSKRGQTAPLSIAPMMERTDRFYRLFIRQITRRTLLYTEMVTTRAILFGDRERLLGYHPQEHPISLQLGGSDPDELAQCARIAEDLGYDEVNINVGCPSDRVQSGSFGVCLMKTPDIVAAGVAAMRAVVDIPVTVKHRIGVDDLDRYEDMARFVEIVSAAQSDRFTVHARKAWLKGLSPKENRNVPPIRYDDVYRLKQDFPDLDIEINGHIKTLDEVRDHLTRVDAAMIGRAAWDNPFLFAQADARIFGDAPVSRTRAEVVEAMLPHIDAYAASGEPPGRFLRPMLNLFAGVPGARRWKQILTTRGHGAKATPDAPREALAAVQAVAERINAA
ncbi:MAG: tRNA dihydrouridine(20/20a) synthase DusA [Myxococcota bacterium]